jgi:hypothetical protein
MRVRCTSSGGEAGRTANVATFGPIAAIANVGTRLATGHVNPTPPATFALNSAKASTALLCCCGGRVCKGCSNREKTDDQQIRHCVLPCVRHHTLFGQCNQVKGLQMRRTGSLGIVALAVADLTQSSQRTISKPTVTWARNVSSPAAIGTGAAAPAARATGGSGPEAEPSVIQATRPICTPAALT